MLLIFLILLLLLSCGGFYFGGATPGVGLVIGLVVLFLFLHLFGIL